MKVCKRRSMSDVGSFIDKYGDYGAQFILGVIGFGIIKELFECAMEKGMPMSASFIGLTIDLNTPKKEM